MGDERVAQVGDPRLAGRALDRRADQVHRGRRRRRQHDVDPLALDDADGRRNRRQVPADVLVRHEQAASGQPCLHPDALEPLPAVELLGRLPALRPEVAGPVHPGERRRLQLVVAMNPLRVVRREHVRLDPEARQVSGELQRPLHAAASRRREVHGHEEDLHAERW